MNPNLYNIAYKPGCRDTLTSSGAIEAGYAVTYGGAQVTASGVACAGVAEEDVSAIGTPFSIIVNGEAPAIAGATLTIGAAVTPGANGRFVIAQSGNYITGRALTEATTGQPFRLRLTHEGTL
jgi:hypothetical protein